MSSAGAVEPETSTARRPAFAALYEKRTSGINDDVTTDHIAEVLGSWADRFGISISEVEPDRLFHLLLGLRPVPAGRDTAKQIW